MKRVHIRIIALLALASAVGWVIFAKTSSSQANQKKTDKGGSDAVLVTTYEVAPTTLRDVLATVGTIKAEETITVRNEVPGKVVALGFEEGERIERGQVLVRMRSDVLKASLQVLEKRASLLETQLERQQQVLARGGVSQQEVDQTANELAVARAEQQRVRAQIDQTVVRAPFDGVVGIRSVSPGAVLSASSPIATLRKVDNLEVEFTVPERHAPAMHLGQEVRFQVHGSSKTHRATINVIEPGLEPSDRSLRVQARIEDPDGAMRPGGFAKVGVLLESIEGALTVPASALTVSDTQSHVWINDGGEAKKQVVETGYRGEKAVEILDGLSAGDEVVGTGYQSLEPGKPLEIDTSEDAMNLDEIGPDPTRSGMRQRWFSGRADHKQTVETAGEESEPGEEDDQDSTGVTEEDK